MSGMDSLFAMPGFAGSGDAAKPRAYPVPPYSTSGDEGIFKMPPDDLVRRNLDFDKMDPDWIYERGKVRSPDTILGGKRIR
jgi:hypothetical protein